MPQTTAIAESDILTPEEFESEFKIKRGTQGAMRSRGQIPFLKLGGGKLIRYRRADILAWLATKSVAASK